MGLPKVLVCCPTSDRKVYCQDDWIYRAKNLTYPNYDIFMCDNSDTKSNFNTLLIEHKIKANYVSPNKRKAVEFIAESHEACRRYAIRNKYDYMMHLESDVFPPLNIIERLLDHNKPVVSGMYHIGIGKESFLMIQQVEEYGDKKQAYNIDSGDIIEVDGTLKKVYHAGLGNCLIRRDVFEKIKFRADRDALVHADSLFATDILNAGIQNFVDTSILCQHFNSEWKSDY